MRKYIQLLLCLNIAIAFTACDMDNEGAKYNESKVSFLSPKNEVVVAPYDTSFEVRVVRTSTVGSETVSLASSGASEFTVPASVTFSDGEAVAFINVSYVSIDFDKSYALTITLPEDQTSPSNVRSIALTISKDYEWISLGIGTFADNWMHPGGTYDVEYLKADGFERYRAVSPYTQAHADDYGEWEGWIASEGPAYVEFWDTTDGLIRFKTFLSGINYDGSANQPIKAYYPSDLSSTASLAFNKKTGAKTYQLAPYYYVDGLGGWNYTGFNNVIVITLP